MGFDVEQPARESRDAGFKLASLTSSSYEGMSTGHCGAGEAELPLNQGATAPEARGRSAASPFQTTKMPKRSTVMICYCCGEKVNTAVEHSACNALNWFICICTGLCCVFIPRCCDGGTNTATHTCPNCGVHLGDSGIV